MQQFMNIMHTVFRWIDNTWEGLKSIWGFLFVAIIVAVVVLALLSEVK